MARPWILIGALFLPPLVIPAARADGLKSCSLPFQTILVEGGFSGLARCDEGNFESRQVGEVAISGKTYAIIDYRYQTKPVSGGSAHGGQRILIVEDGRKYLGQYVIATPPFRAISVRGTSVFVDVPASEGNVIKFDENGPPREAYLTQDPARLFK